MASKLELELQRNMMELLQEKGILNDGEALGDFVIIAELTNFKERLPSRYARILPPEEQPMSWHRLAGLIGIAEEIASADD